MKGNRAMNPSFSRRLLLAAAALLWFSAAVCLMYSQSHGATRTSEQQDRDLYAVVVGINDYKDPAIPALNRSVRDARDFHAFLNDRKDLFSKVHMKLLVGKKATRANVAQALREYLKPAGKDDIVIIYLSGHGDVDSTMPNEFYYLTYDARTANLFGTALLMNDKNLFKGIDSDNVLLLSDACHSGGFSGGLDGAVAKSAGKFLSMFHSLKGRTAISSSRPDELSYEKRVYGNSIFTHFLLKGLRGESDRGSNDGTVTAKELYNYVYKNTRTASAGRQNPQIYCVKGRASATPVFLVPKYARPLDVKVQFFYEDDNKKIRPLENNSVLKSGQHVGIGFRAESDCYVYIFWWDSSGNVGRLFPNPQLTEGTGEIQAGKTYWLPSRGGDRWYVLDDNPGTETVYFAACRKRNPKLEKLYKKLSDLTASAGSGERRQNGARDLKKELTLGSKPSDLKQAGKRIAGKMERELNLMGFAAHTVPKGVQKASFDSKERILEGMENQIEVSGADAVFKVQFRHVAR